MQALRSLLVAILGFVAIVAPVRAQDEINDALFTEMTALVIAHDLAIIVGLLPTPAIQLGGETVELASNLSLKYVPPWLEAPPNLSVNPGVAPTDSSYTVTAGGCGIEFRLLSTQGDYENMFGLANFSQPYVDPDSGVRYRWHGDNANSIDTRWGFLRAPTVWHANTEAKLSLSAREQVRRYDSATGTYTDRDGGVLDESENELFSPILQSEEPQEVYLPIGQHIIDWRAGTQLNRLSDIVVPAGLLAFGMYTEARNAYAGLDRARSIKQSGSISEAAIKAPLDPDGAQRLSDGVLKFDNIWQNAWKKRTAAQDRKWWRELRKEIGCQVGDIALDVLDTALDNHFSTLDVTTSNELYANGKINFVQKVLLDAIHDVWIEKDLDLKIAAVKLFITCDDPEDLIAEVIEILLDDPEADWLKNLLTTETVANVASQYVIVYDSMPPTISLPSTTMVVEATDFGGTRLHRARPTLQAIAEANSTDNCGRRPELLLVAPDLLPLGLNELTWIARDLGPNPPNDSRNFAPTAIQRIMVQDTQPPLLLAPPSKVIEAAGAVPLASANIGDAAAVDLVDVQPSVVNNAPASFPLDQRTTVQWMATDQSNNSATASQLITVKTVGTNTTPIANPATARTLTAQPVDVRLTAADNDVLGAVADPLWFKIESQPARGEFIAPLYPFFIEDYRTRPNDALPDFDPVTDDLRQYIVENYCDRDLQVRQPPIEFVHNAEFVHVTDEGIRYVLDEFFDCAPFEDNAQEVARFSKWTSDGEFLGQVELSASRDDRPLDNTFRVDRDGFLYFYTDLGTGSSNVLRLWRCRTDWVGGTRGKSQVCSESYGFERSSAPNESRLDAEHLKLARIDSATDVAYIADDERLFAFELLDDGGTRYLGEVGPKNGNVVIDNWLGDPSAIEVGLDGSIYVADVANHRIHKIAATRRNAQQQLMLGDYIGWSGRCTGSGNRACDEDLDRSRGYSCTFAPNSCTVAGALSGNAQGQFNQPRYIAIDPNDVLYIADYGNARIQRLSTDGTFAGEAVSDGSGINKGDRPSFVVGNMGPPSSVSVNSSQFFVVDRDEKFVHVFGTLPFKEITPGAVTVTYVSDQNFPNPNITGNDTFTYSVTDGLARSLPATATITVDRNFRAPIAIDSAVTTTEDVSVTFELEADDPDGIAGRDFLGLDTLTYTVTSQPQQGVLSGSGDTWTYQPTAGFSGVDHVKFKANDGRDDSNEGTVTITVTAANDPPEVTIEQPWRVPVGFPMLLRARFLDDPAEGHEGRINWGDNTPLSTTGEITDGHDTDEDPAVNGVVITRPPAPGVAGRVFALHTFTTPGSRTITVCLRDNGGLEGCDTLTVLVEPLVQLGFGAVVYDQPPTEEEVTDQEILDGVPFTYEVTISNGMPSAGPGRTAENLVLEAELPNDLQVLDVSIDQGTCTVTGVALSCAIGSLAPDAEAKLEVRAHGRGTVTAGVTKDLSGLLTTTSDAVEPEVEVLASIDIVPNLADGDGDGMPEGYERANGLDLTRSDHQEDADGDGLTNGTEFEIRTSSRAVDTDGDGLGDFAEHTAGTSDPTLADTDADGMPDGWEIGFGFNARLAADGSADADGDGLVNRQEFTQGKDPHRDDVAPSITPPAEVTVAATGRLTRVELGAASAADARDGAIGAHASPMGPFAPGSHIVTWTAADAAGNDAVAFQRVNVIPLVTFAVDQSVEEGSVASVRVDLNGPAASYPVSIPYSVAGTATSPADHDGASGTVYIASGTGGSIDITTVRDALVDPDESIVLTMGTPTNAVAGVKTQHRIGIAEHNLAPRVSVRVEQGGVAVTTVARDGGNVSVAAAVRDDPGRSHAYDWRRSDSGAFDPTQATAASYVLDATTLGPRTYGLEVRVTDDAVPALRTDTRTVLRVVDRLPFLNPAVDSDGDGRDDRTEGAADTDGDRIAEYLDPFASPNHLRFGSATHALEVSAGHALRLGEVAFALGLPNAAITEDHLTTDASYGYPNGIADFEVTQLELGGQANVVIPLRYPIAPGAVYRKYALGTWRDFSTVRGDAVASAPGGDGVCPPPGSSAYRLGLAPGDACLQLTLTDGGPNDADGLANGAIRDPGGLAAPVAVTVEVIPLSTTLAAAGPDVVMLRIRLRTSSGDAMLRSLTLESSGSGDDSFIENVQLVHDGNADGVAAADEAVLASGRYTRNNGSLTLDLETDLEIPFGTTEILVTYRTGAASP